MHGIHFWGFIYRLNHVANYFPFHFMCSFEIKLKFSSSLFICDPHLTLNQHNVKINRKIIYNNRIKKKLESAETQKRYRFEYRHIRVRNVVTLLDRSCAICKTNTLPLSVLWPFKIEHFSFLAARPIFIFHTSNERIFENEIERNI